MSRTSLRRSALAALAVLLLLALTGCAGADAEPAADSGDDVAAPAADGGGSEAPTEAAMPNPCAADAPTDMMPPAEPPAEGAEIVEVTADDYAFEGLEATYPAGDYGFVLDNPAEEIHEMVVFRIADGEDRPITELLSLPEEEAGEAAEMVAMGFACPGEASDPVGVQLTAGRYAAVCFLPTGSTPDADFAEIGEHAPHFTEGMLHEFTVS